MTRSSIPLGTLLTGLVLTSAAAPSAQDRTPPPLAAPTAPGVSAGRGGGRGTPVTAADIRGFSIVLAVGDLSASGSPGNSIPAAATKALADLKDFLPYKSYRLLDTAWTAGGGHLSSRLRGADNKDYQVELDVRVNFVPLGATPSVSVSRFTVIDTSTSDQAAAAYQRGIQGFDPSRETRPPSNFGDADLRLEDLRAQLATLEAQLAQTRQTYTAQSPQMTKMMTDYDSLQAQYTNLVQQHEEFALRTPDALISTSFTMNVGETVVVGTSRLQGDKALIVLLTAVAK